jgi:hypothetical protein
MPQRMWFRRALWRVLLVAPILVSGPVLLGTGIIAHGSNLVYDFRDCMYNAAVAILHGRNPYEPMFAARQAAIMRAGHIALGELNSTGISVPVYPAFANVLIVPLALLPFWIAAFIFTVLCGTAMIVGLRWLGVTDRRCLGLALISWPFLFGVSLGAVGPLLVLGAGAAWRWRDKLWPPAVAIASIVALKLLPWTLGVWLLVTRRYRTLAICVACCLLLTFGTWALIGFTGMAQYPQMLSNITYVAEGRGISLLTVLLIAGASPAVASATALAACAGILALTAHLARGVDGDRRAFGLSVIAVLATSPLVWEHYMVLLFVPVALASPQLSKLWLAPMAAPVMTAISRAFVADTHRLQAYSPNGLRQALSWLAIELIVAVYLCTSPESRAAVRTRARGVLREPRAVQLLRAVDIRDRDDDLHVPREVRSALRRSRSWCDLAFAPVGRRASVLLAACRRQAPHPRGPRTDHGALGELDDRG